jgi:hypothetical protein
MRLSQSLWGKESIGRAKERHHQHQDRHQQSSETCITVIDLCGDDDSDDNEEARGEKAYFMQNKAIDGENLDFSEDHPSSISVSASFHSLEEDVGQEQHCASLEEDFTVSAVSHSRLRLVTDPSLYRPLIVPLTGVRLGLTKKINTKEKSRVTPSNVIIEEVHSPLDSTFKRSKGRAEKRKGCDTGAEISAGAGAGADDVFCVDEDDMASLEKEPVVSHKKKKALGTVAKAGKSKFIGEAFSIP